MKLSLISILATIMVIGCFTVTVRAESQPGEERPEFLKDREQEIPVSMFGTYINRGQLLVYPFFEYYHDNNAEYSPDELGYGLDEDFRGKARAYEGLLFLGYGLTDNVSIELEAAVIDATLEKSPNDPTNLPSKITESGMGDVQMQLNWMWRKETAKQAGLFTYIEVEFPFNKDKPLTGTTDWEFQIGTGVIRGFSWGTLVVRAAMEYSLEEKEFDVGEVAIEYLKRLSPKWKVFVGVEGFEDEVELITELQWHLSKRIFIKFNSAVGITSKAEDWAPEIGIMFRL